MNHSNLHIRSLWFKLFVTGLGLLDFGFEERWEKIWVSLEGWRELQFVREVTTVLEIIDGGADQL